MKRQGAMGRTQGRPLPGETITVPLELLHDLLDLIDWELRQHDEGPRRDSRSREVWGGEWPAREGDSREAGAAAFTCFEFEIEQRLHGILRQREIDLAVADALANRARGPLAVVPAGAGGGR